MFSIFSRHFDYKKGFITALKITFENLPIIKIMAVEKKVAHHGWASRKCFRNENFESVWTRLQKISVLSHAFHDFFKRSLESNEGDLTTNHIIFFTITPAKNTEYPLIVWIQKTTTVLSLSYSNVEIYFLESRRRCIRTKEMFSRQYQRIKC